MDEPSKQVRSEELLTLTQAVREGRGKVKYHQLWDGIQTGRVVAFQPSGPRGRYLITRAELERVVAPVRPPGKTK